MTTRPELHILFEGMARVYDHTEADVLFEALEASNAELRGEVERMKYENTRLLNDASIWRNRAIGAEEELSGSSRMDLREGFER
jgi:hypothetical protein